MADKYIVQRRTASGLEMVAELPCLENGKVGLSWLPVVGTMGSAIIERGSNANGEYVKFADGTQVCYRNYSVSMSIEASVGNLFYNSGGIAATYPASFVSLPSILVSTADADETTRTYFCGLGSGGSVTRTPAIYVLRPVSTPDVTVNIMYLAIGRWK